MNLAANLSAIQHTIAQACQRVGRSPHEVKLLAVSKYADEGAIQAAAELGLRAFAENRIQQARQRLQRFPELEWHFIGTLQTNKVKYCRDFALIHSLDRLSLAEEVQKWADRWGKTVDMLIQVNASGEDSKHGVAIGDVESFALQIKESFPNIRVRGLMTMAPFDEAEKTRPVFRYVRELSTRIGKLTGWEMDILSMGMSNDFPVAIEEGATLVRIGSALFKEGEYGVGI